jgi:hypothetical protein
MGPVKDNFFPVSEYNRLPFIEEMHQVAENHKEDLDYLCGLLKKHSLPPSVCIKLIHIHFHLNEGEIMAFSQFSAPPHGQIPFLGPMMNQTTSQYYGSHYLVDNAGDLQAFEYTTIERGVDLVAYPAFVAEFCAAVVQRSLQHKLGLAIKTGAAAHGSWIELDFPEKRATFLIPSHISLPKSEHVVQTTTKTQFYPPGELSSQTCSHTEHRHSEFSAPGDETLVEGVSTKNGLFLTGMPLESGTAFYGVVSAMAVAAA